jgi:hypothetical protein
MKKDKIQEAYELMLIEKKVEVVATLESIEDYLDFFSQALKKGTLEGDLQYATDNLEKISKISLDIKKRVDKAIKMNKM